MKKLSVVTIAKNEEKNIEEFLHHIQWADEIIVVDNGSKDKTVEIAKKYTDKVYSFTEKHYGRLKQYTVSKATKDWILVLDVDEFINDLLQREIKDVLRSNDIYSGFKIMRVGYIFDQRLHAKGFHEYKTRLFKRGSGRITQVPVHEEVIVTGKVGKLNGEILHYSYRSIGQILSKLTLYAKMEAPSIFQRGERVSIKKFTLYPLHMFYSIFIKDEGWRDGIYGFLLALCFAYYEFMRYYYLLKFQLFGEKPA